MQARSYRRRRSHYYLSGSLYVPDHEAPRQVYRRLIQAACHVRRLRSRHRLPKVRASVCYREASCAKHSDVPVYTGQCGACRSAAVMRRVVNTQDASSIEYDVCSNKHCKGTFGKALPSEDRPARRGERCRLCGAPHFMKLNEVIISYQRCACTRCHACWSWCSCDNVS